MQPDATDWEIIKLLSVKQMTNNAVALELGVNEATIRLRIKKLKKSGILKIRAPNKPRSIGKSTIDNHVRQRQQF